MMRHLTVARVDDILDVPIAMPAAEVRRGDSVVVATFSIDLTQTARIRWMQMHLVRVDTVGSAILVDDAFGTVYAGVAYSYSGIGAPAGVPAGLVQTSIVGVAQANPNASVDFTSPGEYSVVVVNNSTNMDVQVSLVGAVRIYAPQG